MLRTCALKQPLIRLDIYYFRPMKRCHEACGHEAPPVNPDYEPDFSQYRVDGVAPGMVRVAAEQRVAREAAVEFGAIPDRPPGLLIGTGGDVPVRIPKFDEDGNQIGYYVAINVPRAARFGLPKDPSKIAGCIPRNAKGGRHLKVIRMNHTPNSRG